MCTKTSKERTQRNRKKKTTKIRRAFTFKHDYKTSDEENPNITMKRMNQIEQKWKWQGEQTMSTNPSYGHVWMN
jgi:hypothetical protein